MKPMVCKECGKELNHKPELRSQGVFKWLCLCGKVNWHTYTRDDTGESRSEHKKVTKDLKAKEVK